MQRSRLRDFGFQVASHLGPVFSSQVQRSRLRDFGFQVASHLGPVLQPYLNTIENTLFPADTPLAVLMTSFLVLVYLFGAVLNPLRRLGIRTWAFLAGICFFLR